MLPPAKVLKEDRSILLLAPVASMVLPQVVAGIARGCREEDLPARRGRHVHVAERRHGGEGQRPAAGCGQVDVGQGRHRVRKRLVRSDDQAEPEASERVVIFVESMSVKLSPVCTLAEPFSDTPSSVRPPSTCAVVMTVKLPWPMPNAPTQIRP